MNTNNNISIYSNYKIINVHLIEINYSPLFEELTVMKQLELLRYAFNSMESLVSKEVNKTFE